MLPEEKKSDDVFNYVEMFSLDWTDCGGRRRGQVGRKEEKGRKGEKAECLCKVCACVTLDQLKE